MPRRTLARVSVTTQSLIPTPTAAGDAVRDTSLFNQLVNVPHRAIGPMVQAFRAAFNQDADMTARTLVYIARKSKIRDQQVAAVVALLTAPVEYPDFREAGRVTLLGPDVYKDILPEKYVAGLDPHLVLRALDFIASPWAIMFNGTEVRRYMSRKAAERNLQTVANFLTSKAQKELDSKPGNKVKAQPLPLQALSVWRDPNHVQAPRLLHAVAQDWVNAMQANEARWDGILMRNRKLVRELLDHYKFGVNKRTFAILNGEMPENSKMAAIKQVTALVEAGDMAGAAQAAIKASLPYAMASGLLGNDDPISQVALIALMTPQEALNSIAWVEASGVLVDQEVKRAFAQKVAKATASGATILNRKSAQTSDAELNAAKAQARQGAVEKTASINDDVVVIIDGSGSQQKAIVISTRLVAEIAPRVTGRLIVLLCDAQARKIEATNPRSAAEWTMLMGRLKAGGHTDLECGWTKVREIQRDEERLWQAKMQAAKARGETVAPFVPFEPGKLIIVTDGGENAGRFGNKIGSLAAAVAETPNIPAVFIMALKDNVNHPYAQMFTDSFTMRGITPDVIDADQGDWNFLDQIGALLAGEKRKTLQQTVADQELPRRASWVRPMPKMVEF